MKKYAKLTVEIVSAGKYSCHNAGKVIEINKNFAKNPPKEGDTIVLGPTYGKSTKDMQAWARVVSVDGVGSY